MTPKQVIEQLKIELLRNDRIAQLLTTYMKDYADAEYRKTKFVTDYESLLLHTRNAAAVEHFIKTIAPEEMGR